MCRLVVAVSFGYSFGAISLYVSCCVTYDVDVLRLLVVAYYAMTYCNMLILIYDTIYYNML